MKSLRVFAMVVAAMGLLTAVSCSKETPAEEIDDTTQKLEGQAEKLQNEADAKAAEIMDRTKKTELPK